jgi:probable phosphoglycerate mutase
MSTRFVVVRHGQTQWNVEARVQGHRDSPLTAQGLEQAEAIGKRLAREHFDVLVASDLGRAMQTAQRIAAHCGLPIAADPRLRERDFGEGEGLSYEEIDARWPNVFSRTAEVDPDLAIPGGESRRQFHDRIHQAFESLARKHDGRRVLVVSHGGVLTSLYRVIHGIPVARPHRVSISNASYSAVVFDADAWTLEAWDDVAHLPGVVPFVES